MNTEIFDIGNLKLIQDKENCYFFRALNMADNKDLEDKVITNENGKICKIRTDLDRFEGLAKYSQASKLSLEQIYDHIKINYRKDTNCVSLSCNANVSIYYGREFYKDKYILVKIPKKELGTRVVNAGKYILEEIDKNIEDYIYKNKISDIIEKDFMKIENCVKNEQLIKIVKTKFKSKIKISNKSNSSKKICCRKPFARITNCKWLSDDQILARNKIVAKLTVLERKYKMKPIIPNTCNNNILVDTIDRAFSSLEFIHYGQIKEENIIEIPTEVIDVISIIQKNV